MSKKNMKCDRCQYEVPEDSNYCSQCGHHLGQPTAEDLVRRGIHHFCHGENEKAIAHFKEAIFTLPKETIIHRLLADILFQLGRLEESEIEYRKTIQLDARDAYSLSGLGRIYYRRADFRRAIEVFEEALLINPSFTLVLYWLGLAYYHCGKLDLAIKAHENVLRSHPEYVICHYHLGIQHSAKNEQEKAIEHFKKVIEANPNHVSAHYHLGVACYRNSDITSALKYFHRALELDPEDERVKERLEHLENIDEP